MDTKYTPFKLYPVYRKETKMGYQYLVGVSTPKQYFRPPNISVQAVFVYSISAFTRKQAVDTLKTNLRKSEPKPMYQGEEARKLGALPAQTAHILQREAMKGV